MWNDLRLSLRLLRRDAAFTLLTVLTLMLGAGAVGAVLVVVNAVLFQPLPYREPDELVLVSGTLERDGAVEDWPLSYLDITDLRLRNRSFEELVIATPSQSLNLAQEGFETAIVAVEMVSAEYFPLLGVEPLTGRTFLPREDDAPGEPRLAVLSYGLWSSRFGRDPAVVGRTIELDEVGFTVIGVMPRGFRGVTDECDLWVPISMATMLGRHYLEAREMRWLSAVGRLRDGVPLGRAAEDLARVSRELAAEHPDTNRDLGARLEPLRDAWFGDLRPALLTLLAAAGFVLLIALTNVANLQLVRALKRHQEVTVRLALGAGRGRVVRLLLTEGVLLALAGALAGLALAQLATAPLVDASGLELRSFAAVRVDGAVIAAVTLTLAALGLAFGLGPALLASRVSLAPTLKQGGRSAAGGRLQQRLQALLCVAEIALALVLLVGAGLMIKGFQRLTRQDLGLRREGLLTMKVNLTSRRYADDAAIWPLVRRAIEELETLPGVRSVAVGGPGVPTDAWYGGFVTPEAGDGTGGGLADGMRPITRHHASPGYFATLGVPLERGRSFTFADDPGSTYVAVASRELAERFWPGEDPIDKRLKIGSLDSPYPWVRVVGVVGDVRHTGLESVSPPGPDLYFSLMQIVPRTPRQLYLLLRSEVPPASLAETVRRRFAAVSPHLALHDVATMEERLARQSADARFGVLLINLFALLALALASVGIYGVVSYGVAQRTREIGIRMALGADAGRVVGRTLGRSAGMALLGIGIGLAAALALARLLASRLYGIDPLDLQVLLGASAILLLIALVASWVPSRRAGRLMPMGVLRQE